MKARGFLSYQHAFSAHLQCLVIRQREAMPRIRNPKFRTHTRVNWDRSSGGRLLRLDNPAQFVDRDILVYNIDNVNLFAVAQHSSDQRIPPLVPFTSTETEQVFNFGKAQLPGAHPNVSRNFRHRSFEQSFLLPVQLLFQQLHPAGQPASSF